MVPRLPTAGVKCSLILLPQKRGLIEKFISLKEKFVFKVIFRIYLSTVGPFACSHAPSLVLLTMLAPVQRCVLDTWVRNLTHTILPEYNGFC